MEIITIATEQQANHAISNFNKTTHEDGAYNRYDHYSQKRNMAAVLNEFASSLSIEQLTLLISNVNVYK